jgi:hypothetical protein
MLLHGVTQPREVPYVSKPQRATMKIIVALIPGLDQVVVGRVGGRTKNTGLQPAEVFKKRDGSVAKGLCGSEYLHFLQHIFEDVYKTGKRNVRGPRLALVHDRDPAHKDVRVKKYLEERGIVNCMLPTRSPDLDPLDYCVFGHSKRSVGRRDVSTLEGFSDKCKALIQHLESLDARVQTAGFKARLQRVIDAQGGHI